MSICRNVEYGSPLENKAAAAEAGVREQPI